MGDGAPSHDNKEGNAVGEMSTACPVCKRSEGVDERRVNSSVVSYRCPVCGKYEMPPFVPEIQAPNHKLSAWIREQNERGELPRFTREGMIESILVGIPDYRPLEKQLKLLQAIERRSDVPGTIVTLSADKDVPLAYSRTSEEFAFHLRALEERRLLRGFTGSIWQVKITPYGWDYLDKHASDLEEKTQAFVAMSFSDKMRPFWKDAIEHAITDAGYTPYRVDEEPHSDNIIFKIMAEIRNSAVCGRRRHGTEERRLLRGRIRPRVGVARHMERPQRRGRQGAF